MTQVSPRCDVHQLKSQLASKLVQRQARESGICQVSMGARRSGGQGARWPGGYVELWAGCKVSRWLGGWVAKWLGSHVDR